MFMFIATGCLTAAKFGKSQKKNDLQHTQTITCSTAMLPFCYVQQTVCSSCHLPQEGAIEHQCCINLVYNTLEGLLLCVGRFDTGNLIFTNNQQAADAAPPCWRAVDNSICAFKNFSIPQRKFGAA
jgi:hypothetical protein